MRALALTAALLATAPAAAQVPPAGTAGAPPSEAQLQAATDTLSVFVSALNAPNIGRETKAGLLLCLYANPLGKLAEAQTKALSHNPKLDPKSPAQRLALVAAMCRTPLAVPAAQPKK